jgi:hypothetical protein
MTDDTHEIPVAEVYRSVEIYDLQSAEHIAEAKRQIDRVISMSEPRRLFDFAIDARNSPEARQLAKLKALATREERQRVAFDVDRLKACTIGIERCATRLARLIGYKDAMDDRSDPNRGWPAEWYPPPRCPTK